MATKESLVHSFNGGKVLYVEPNDIYGYTKDDEGHSIPITPPYQDLCIAFDLVADVYSRTNAGIRKATKTLNDDNKKTSYIMSFHSKPRMDSQTFLQGTGYGEYDKKNGKFDDYYLTTYYSKREFGAYIADKQVVEGLGVESVQIDMQHWYTPTITINFVDVRGVALWGQEEAIRDDNGTISVENVFGSFFTLPYPVFHLVVKGFFGRPVTYQLSLSSFKGEYDNDGSFKVSATFIGYQYSLLTDIPMRYLVAAPYCEYEGKQYWNNHANSEEWKLSDGNPPPRLYEFYEKVKGAVFTPPQNEAGNLPDTNIVLLEKEKLVLREIQTDLAEIRRQLAYGGRKTIIDIDDVTHQETIFFLTNPDTVSDNGRTGTVTINFGGMKDSIVKLNKAVDAYKCNYGNLRGKFDEFHSMLNNLINGNINNHDGLLTYDGKNFGVYKVFTYDDENFCISDLNDAFLSKKYASFINQIKDWFIKKINIGDTPVFNDNKMISLKIHKVRWDDIKKSFYNEFIKVKGINQNVYAGVFHLYDSYFYVTQRLNEIESEITAIREGVDKNRNFDILEAIGFKPYIGDFLKIVMCHMETFIHMIKQSEIDAEGEKKQRKLTNASWTDWNDQLLNGQNYVPCWVGVTKTDTKLTQYDENGNNPTEGSVSWLGAFEEENENGGRTENFVETRVVNSLLKALACTMTTPEEPAQVIEDANVLNSYRHFPTLPFDFNINENPFTAVMEELNGGSNLQTLVGYLGIRACQIVNSLKSTQNPYGVMSAIGELDAYNWYQAAQNGTKLEEFIFNPLNDLSKDGEVGDIIYGILSGDPYYKETYKLDNPNGTRSYPFQIIKGAEEQYMFRPWGDDTTFVEASYINENGVCLTPTKFKKFEKYRFDNQYPCFTFIGDKVYPHYDMPNNKDRIACDWIAPYKMYNPNNVLYKKYYEDTYNNDLYNIMDSRNVINAIKAKYWQLKDKIRLNVTDEYANEMPNYDEYLTFMYSNFDEDYELWLGLWLSCTTQFIVGSKHQMTPLVKDEATFKKYTTLLKTKQLVVAGIIEASDESVEIYDYQTVETDTHVNDRKIEYNDANEFKKKRIKISPRKKSANRVSDDRYDIFSLRDELLLEDVIKDEKETRCEEITSHEMYFPSCVIYSENSLNDSNNISNGTNLFTHTAYYNTPYKYFNQDEHFKLDNNEIIKMRKLYRCAMFLFTFRYALENTKKMWFETSGVKRLPKGLVLQLGAMAWWRKTFDNLTHENFTTNLNSDFPRYTKTGNRVLFPFCKDTNHSWKFVYVSKGSANESKYVTYENSMLYAFTKGDTMFENMLCRRFEEFALTDRSDSNELIFDQIREALELRMDNLSFDSPVERNYIQGSLIHKTNVALGERLTRKDENGENVPCKFDWNHFSKYYAGMFVCDQDLDAFFKYDEAMAPIQDIFRSIYLDDWILLTTVTNKTDIQQTKNVQENIIEPMYIQAYFNKFYYTIKDIVEHTSKNMNVAYLSKMEGLSGGADDNLENIKIGIYNYIKNLYDKWLLQVDEDAFTVKNFYKTNFYFMTSYYENIYSKLVINCELVTDLYRNMAHEQSLFNYIDHVISDHNCQLYITPDFIPFGQDLKENKELLYDVFKPYAYHDLSLNEHYNGLNMASYANSNRFIAVLKSEIPNTIAPPTYTEYKQDGFTMVTEIGQKDADGNKMYEGTDDLSNIFPTRKAELLNDKTNYAVLTDNSVWDGVVPCFGVTMSRQNQHLFENVKLNMENPIVTDISARTYEDIVNVGKSGERRVYFHGQDIYKVYSAYSYGCGVTMLGNAQIQPLMYFQLNNIPMWHGAYMIYKVSHSISPGSMTTTFEGQRVSRRRAVINQDFAHGASLLDYSVGEGKEEIQYGKQTVNYTTLNKLNHPIEVSPYRLSGSPFKTKLYHQTDNTYTQAQSSNPKYFKVLEDTFNELVQLNSLQGFGDRIEISSMYRSSPSSNSDHSNPKKYSDIQYVDRNCAMDLQVKSQNPQRDHKIDLCAPYLLYLLKRDDIRQVILEVGLPSNDPKTNKQSLIGDDTYLHCFHVSLKDEGLNRHPVPFGIFIWKDTGNGNYNWGVIQVSVDELPVSIAMVLYKYLEHCKQKGKLNTFAQMTKQIDFGVKVFDYEVCRQKLWNNITANCDNTTIINTLLKF